MTNDRMTNEVGPSFSSLVIGAWSLVLYNIDGVGLCTTEAFSSSVSGSVDSSQLWYPASALPCSNFPERGPVSCSVAQRTYARNCCSELKVATSRRATPCLEP